MFVYNKLKGRIVEKLGNVLTFGEKMGISKTALYLKLNGKYDFTQEEIYKAMEVLEIKPEDLHLYFFTVKIE